jgi:hypothetical protein
VTIKRRTYLDEWQLIQEETLAGVVVVSNFGDKALWCEASWLEERGGFWR